MKRYTHIFAILVLAWTGTTQAAPVLNGAYTFDGTESSLTERLNRNGVASDWGSPKSFLGGFFGTFPYQVFGFNSGANPFLQITYDGQGTSANMQVALYAGGSFNAANISTGYLADAGVSTGVPQTPRVFRFDGATNTNYDLVAYNISNAIGTVGICVEGFSTAVSPRPGACTVNYQGSLTTPSGQVPLPSTLALLMLGFACIKGSRRKIM